MDRIDTNIHHFVFRENIIEITEKLYYLVGTLWLISIEWQPR